MEEDDHVGHNDVNAFSQWLWSKPLGQHDAKEDDEEEVLVGAEELCLPEQEVQSRHLFSRKTVSREVPVEISRSGRVYQTAQHSRMEYSRPTMNIKSRWSHWSSSPRPLPNPPVPSLTSWTHTVNSHHSPPQLTNSGSPSPGGGRLRRLSLMAPSGTTPRKISSVSSTRGTERLQ
ncbi:TPA_asm: P4 protein [Kalanchoe marnieriana polerovirus]|uniref:P4 protein n=1 Tax=Kalanchoe marnieriana polerovirus TaxID=2885086 RepID=A0AAD2KQ61_9VIRU|nr:TPA_asm: P4 protein [Kalanchoe marnieriana polerovirus]